MKIQKENTDVKDKKILVLLSENSRMPISKIAKKVRLSRETTHYRIKRMEQKGIILDYIPDLDFKKLGFETFTIFMLLNEKDQEKQKDLIEFLKKHPNTVSLIEFSDRWDLEWRLIAKNIDDFDPISAEISNKFSGIIMEKTKLISVKEYRSIILPYDFNERKYLRKKTKKKGKIKIDNQDMRILRALSKNSRQSNYELAKKVKLSADSIRIRIKKLLDQDVIKRFTILLDFQALGLDWYTFYIQVRFFSGDKELKFKEFIKNHPHILRATKTLGMSDLLISIIAQNTKEFHDTIKEIKYKFSDILLNYETLIAYEQHIFLPVPKIIF